MALKYTKEESNYNLFFGVCGDEYEHSSKNYLSKSNQIAYNFSNGKVLTNTGFFPCGPGLNVGDTIRIEIDLAS